MKFLYLFTNTNTNMKNLNLKLDSLRNSYVPGFLNSSKEKLGEILTSLTQSESDYLTMTENTDSDIKELLNSKMELETIIGLKFILIYVNDNNTLHRWNVIHIATSLRNQSISLDCSKQIIPFFTDSNPLIRRLALISIVQYIKEFNLNNQNICLTEDEFTKVLKKYVNDPHPLIFSTAFYAICEVQNKDYLSLNLPLSFTYVCNNLSKVDDFYYERVVFSLINFSKLFILNNFEKNYVHYKLLFDSIFKCVKYTTNNSKIISSGFALNELILAVKNLNLNKISKEEHQLFKNNRQLLKLSNILIKTVLSAKKDYEKYLSLDLVYKFVNCTNNSENQEENFLSIIKSNIQKYFNIFFLNCSNKEYINKKCLDILIHLANENNINKILDEFTRNLNYPNLNLKRSIINSIYRICLLNSNRTYPGVNYSSNNNITSLCIEKLIEFLKLKEEGIISQIIICLRKLILEIKEHTKFVLIYNIKNYRKNVTSAIAKANIIWMISQFIDIIPTVSVDFLRRILLEIDNESDEVKFQILSLVIRIHSNLDSIAKNYAEESRELIITRILGLIDYATEKLLWDKNHNLREKARMINFIIKNNLHHKENDFISNYKIFQEKKYTTFENGENKSYKHSFAISLFSNITDNHQKFSEEKFKFDELDKNVDPQLFQITLDDIINMNKQEESEIKNSNNLVNHIKLDNQKYISVKQENNVNKTIENFESNFNLEELKKKMRNELDEFLNQDDEEGDEYEVEIKRG